MSRLPPGWEWTTVEKVGEVNLGRQRSPQHHSGLHMRPYLRVANVFENRIDTSDVKEMNFTPEEFERYALRRGDILLNEGQSRELVGRPAMFRDEVPGACFQNTLVRFRASEATLPEYALAVFRSYFHTEQFQRICKWTTNIAHLGAERFASMPFPLAPLPEQKRIADKLDALLARVDACRERLDRVPLLLKRFRQAVLAAATSGELTEEWRDQRSRSREMWSTKTGREVFPFVTSGSRGWATRYSETGASFLRVGNLDHDTIDLDLRDVQKVTPPRGAEGTRTRIEVGDILVSITADVGMVGLVREDMGEAYINQHLCLARQTGEYIAAYLAYFLASPTGGLAQLTEAQRGATKAGLTLGDIRELQIDLPAQDEQHEIVRRVESLFAYADRLEARYQTARTHVDRLTPALLAKAFRGELVPQDPNDEPASVLLDRVRAERPLSGKPALFPRPSAPRGEGCKAPPPLGGRGWGEGDPVAPRNIPAAILAHIQPGRAHSRAEVCEALGLTSTEWTWAIRDLKESGRVVQEGERRGARYSLARRAGKGHSV